MRNIIIGALLVLALALGAATALDARYDGRTLLATIALVAAGIVTAGRGRR